MGLLRRLLGKSETASPTPEERQLAGLAEAVEVRVVVGEREPVVRITRELREWDVPDEGAVDIWWRGYDLHDEGDRGWRLNDPVLSQLGIICTKVVGMEYYRGMMLPNVGPGRRLRLVREPENQHDPNAVAIWDAAGQEKIGHLPREIAVPVSESLRVGNQLDAMCISELIKRPGDVRIGLRVVVAPHGLVKGWPRA